MKPLTKRQTEVLDFIKHQMINHGLPPTRVEIAEHFDFKSANAAEDHVKALEAKGHIRVLKGISRGIQVVSWESKAA